MSERRSRFESVSEDTKLRIGMAALLVFSAAGTTTIVLTSEHNQPLASPVLPLSSSTPERPCGGVRATDSLGHILLTETFKKTDGISPENVEVQAGGYTAFEYLQPGDFSVTFRPPSRVLDASENHTFHIYNTFQYKTGNQITNSCLVQSSPQH